jgi:hypothetical protein
VAHAALLVYERPLEAPSFSAGALASAGDPMPEHLPADSLAELKATTAAAARASESPSKPPNPAAPGDFGGGGGAASPGAPVPVFDNASPTPVYTIGFPLSAVAPSGAGPVGLGFVGMKVAGTDCVVNGILWP